MPKGQSHDPAKVQKKFAKAEVVVGQVEDYLLKLAASMKVGDVQAPFQLIQARRVMLQGILEIMLEMDQ